MSFGFAKPPGSLFGQSTVGATQAQPSLFGSTTQQQQNQPQQGSSLFGAGTFGQQPQQQQQQQQQQQPAATTSLFGSTLGQQQPQQPITQPSLFGGFGQSTTQQSTNQPQQGQQNTSSLFGSTITQPQPQPQQQNLFSGFGNNATGANNNAFGQSMTGGFGAANQLQKQQTLPVGGLNTSMNTFFKQPSQQTFVFKFSGLMTQTVGPPLFIKSTKFNDLPEDVKKVLENIDTHIQGRIQISSDLKQRKLGEEATKGQELLRTVHKELVSAITILQNDVHQMRDLQTKTEQTVQDTVAATRIIDGFRNPQQNGQHLKTYASFPLEFFERVSEEMRSRLRWYKSTIEQIERKLSSVAAQTQPTPHGTLLLPLYPSQTPVPVPVSWRPTSRPISSTLQAQHATFVALASKTAALDAELQKIKALYTQLWRAKTGSRRDPFNELDRGSGFEFGLDGLGGK
ncbi:hypothetical protein BDY19DRAFT_991682 [Irpex rosettiformis]|uniref:Uncharacterized protein n=1 Tax=Irpex rosettiformis TaxID=378272 RepID=A0ACB8U9M9_9APHY|nr:hypothetical protein BDY19DRAFT_991682 [Irpex rosettiformis]